MSTSTFTGRHLSWLAGMLLVLNGSAASVCVADDLPSAVNSELLDLARAFRSLDQSYQYRGMSSRLASTAGSVFVDWNAKGVPPEHRYPVVPPAPVLVGCAGTKSASQEADCACGQHGLKQPPCSDCGAEHHTPLHGNGGCAATIGIPLHPRCNDCAATIGIPLHPHAAHQHGDGCSACQSKCTDCQSTGDPARSVDAVPCHDCFVIEQYRDGQLTRTRVPCDRCKASGSHD
jgi:hypothetical protein